MLRFSAYKALLILIICLVAVFCSLSNFVPDSKKHSLPYSFLPDKKVSLGLDLQGGSHLLLQVNFDSYLQEQLKNISDDLKRDFIDSSLSASTEINNNKIIFNFSDNSYVDKAKKIIKKLNPTLEINQDGNKLELAYSNPDLVKIQRDLIKQSIEITRRRVDEAGTREPIIQAQGNNRILLQVPGISNPQEIRDLLGKTAKLTFHFVINNPQQKDASQYYLDDEEVVQDAAGNSFVIKKEAILTGDLLIDANATYYEGKPAVSFKFNQVGARKFSEITSNNIGKIFAIVLDDEIITAPKIHSAIQGGAGVISGSFNATQANDLALLLRAGALPAPIDIIEERTVGPSLGADSIHYGTNAAIYGFILVAVFMIIFYGLFGIIADIALVINLALILTLLSWLGATLTLPGIAGIVLTIGMAVDSNVLIFERMKEEARNHHNRVLTAIDSGFSQAFRTIMDSNITTLIIAFLLYIFGSGAVRGFAVTLTIGILCSMFSAIVVSKTIISMWIKYRKTPLKTLPI